MHLFRRSAGRHRADAVQPPRLELDTTRRLPAPTVPPYRIDTRRHVTGEAPLNIANLTRTPRS